MKYRRKDIKTVVKYSDSKDKLWRRIQTRGGFLDIIIVVLLGIIFVFIAALLLFIVKLVKKYDDNGLDDLMREEFLRNREEINRNLSGNRIESNSQFASFQDSVIKRMNEIEYGQRSNFESFSNSQRLKFSDFEAKQKEISDFVFQNLKEFNSLSEKKISEIIALNSANAQSVRNELQTFMNGTETKLSGMKDNIDANLKEIRKNNTEQLDRMRDTVDEKLHKTLESRLTESFKMVSERLETVQKGLGEMQTLASGVGDLKRVLSNIKTKGVLGEYQLENILEQILTPSQYEKNINTNPKSGERVEFAVKMPGKDSGDNFVFLPIDAKFPTEDYQALLNAYDEGDQTKIAQSQKALEQKIKSFARDIKTKYVCPPHTTDFALMFLPFEGLYAEVLRINGLFEYLQREYKITITGPTTVSAFLNSLQMGFRTLAIQKRSSEVWELLGTVKTEFSNFAGILDKTQKKLGEASRVIEQAGIRTRAIERKLRDVEALPSEQEFGVLEESAEPSESEY